MILTWLKHQIFEICIDNIFHEIQKNFPMITRDLSSFATGDFVEVRIVFGDASKEFKQCKVVYKNGKNMIIEAYDTHVPLKMILINGTVSNISFDNKSYEDFF